MEEKRHKKSLVEISCLRDEEADFILYTRFATLSGLLKYYVSF